MCWYRCYIREIPGGTRTVPCGTELLTVDVDKFPSLQHGFPLIVDPSIQFPIYLYFKHFVCCHSKTTHLKRFSKPCNQVGSLLFLLPPISHHDDEAVAIFIISLKPCCLRPGKQMNSIKSISSLLNTFSFFYVVLTQLVIFPSFPLHGVELCWQPINLLGKHRSQSSPPEDAWCPCLRHCTFLFPDRIPKIWCLIKIHGHNVESLLKSQWCSVEFRDVSHRRSSGKE